MASHSEKSDFDPKPVHVGFTAHEFTGTGLSSTTLVLPAKFHSTNYLYSHSLTYLRTATIVGA